MKNKVPQVTLAFWIIKIAATTLGETGGDALSMTLQLGYVVSTAIFFRIFCRHGDGTDCSDETASLPLLGGYRRNDHGGHNDVRLFHAHRRLGYLWSSVVFFISVLVVLAVWYFAVGTVNVNHITNRKAETFTG